MKERTDDVRILVRVYLTSHSRIPCATRRSSTAREKRDREKAEQEKDALEMLVQCLLFLLEHVDLLKHIRQHGDIVGISAQAVRLCRAGRDRLTRQRIILAEKE